MGAKDTPFKDPESLPQWPKGRTDRDPQAGGEPSPLLRMREETGKKPAAVPGRKGSLTGGSDRERKGHRGI